MDKYNGGNEVYFVNKLTKNVLKCNTVGTDSNGKRITVETP